MADALDLAFTEIYHSIPEPILRMAFKERAPNAQLLLPIHQVMCQRVIYDRVLKECNITGGLVKHIPLRPEYAEATIGTSLMASADGNYGRIYRIPAAERDNCNISDVIGISPPIALSQVSGLPSAGRNVINTAITALESYTGTSLQSLPLVELMRGNMVRVSPANYSDQLWIISVRLEYDTQFTNMNQQAIMPFARLVVAAVKAYIYNKLYIDLDRVAMEAGVELNAIRSVIERYEPEEETYKELLLQFTGGSILSPERKQRLFEYML